MIGLTRGMPSSSASIGFITSFTNFVAYWQKSPLGDDDKPESYRRIDLAVEAEAETEYGDIQQETIYTGWILADGIQEEIFAAWKSDFLLRRLLGRRDAAPIITVSVDPKDGDIKVGDYLLFTTDELCNPDGTPVSTRFQIVKRDPKGSKIDYKLQRMPVRRSCFYAPDAATHYDTATDAQREYGGFYADDHGKNSDGSGGSFYY